MNMTLEDRLRDAYQAAACTVRPDTIHAGVRYHAAPAARSHRRFTIFAPIAAAAAVVAVVAAAVTVPGHLAGRPANRASAAVTSSATAGTGPFLLEVAGALGGTKLAVQQAGTRHVTALIPAPDGALTWDAVSSAGGSTFIAAATTSRDGGYTSTLYRITLSASGKPSEHAVSPPIPGVISALACSQGGHQIAYAIPSRTSKAATLSVIYGTGTRHWTIPIAGDPGQTGWLPDSLLLSADGSELGFITVRIADTVGPVRSASTVWLLPVRSAPGSAIARSHKVTVGPPDTAPFSAALSPDGKTMYVLSEATVVPDSTPASRTETATLSAYSTADGGLIRTIHTWTGLAGGTFGSPGLTISGGQLLVWGIDGSAAYQVDAASGATKPVWIYSLQETNVYVSSSTIAW